MFEGVPVELEFAGHTERLHSFGPGNQVGSFREHLFRVTPALRARPTERPILDNRNLFTGVT